MVEVESTQYECDTLYAWNWHLDTDIAFLVTFLEIASCLSLFPCLAATMRSIPSDTTPGPKWNPKHDQNLVVILSTPQKSRMLRCVVLGSTCIHFAFSKATRLCPSQRLLKMCSFLSQGCELLLSLPQHLVSVRDVTFPLPAGQRWESMARTSPSDFWKPFKQKLWEDFKANWNSQISQVEILNSSTVSPIPSPNDKYSH